MSTFKPYAMTCKYGSMEILTSSVTRESGTRLAKFSVPGIDGEQIQHLGSPSITDSVSALMTVPEVDKFKKLIRGKKAQVWNHPLLPTIEGFVEQFTIDGNSELYGYLACDFTVVETRDPHEIVLPTAVFTLPGKKAAAQSTWDGLSNNVAAKPAWDGTGGSTAQNASSFDSAWSDLDESWTNLEATFEGVEEGESSWSDLARAVDNFRSFGEVFIDAARDVEEFIGETANDIQTAPRLIVEAGRDAVEAVREDVDNIVTLVVTQPTDLPTLIIDTIGEIDDVVMESVMESNILDNPFMILPGAKISLPLG